VDDTAEMVAWMDPPGIRRPSHLLGGPGEMGDAADTEDATPMLGGGPMSLYDCECFLIQLEGRDHVHERSPAGSARRA
jgi:hypothetical protein